MIHVVRLAPQCVLLFLRIAQNGDVEADAELFEEEAKPFLRHLLGEVNAFRRPNVALDSRSTRWLDLSEVRTDKQVSKVLNCIRISN